jgi:S-(hydroxymethyl)glutathione dehydrogenase/alcohol dehydrogenase
VGQSVILGLRLVGAHPVIAADLAEERLTAAREFGATHTLRGDDPKLEELVTEITEGGADYAFDAIGATQVAERLPGMLCSGGAAVLVGTPAPDARSSFSPFDLVDAGKRILGSNYGSSVPALDFPRLAELHLAGRLPLDRLVGRVRPLSEVNYAFDDLRNAVGLRTVIRF